MTHVQNILFCSSYSTLGGGETWLLTLAEQLDPRRYQPHLLVNGEGALAQRWRARGWPVHLDHWRGASTYFVPAIYARFPIRQRIARLIDEQAIAAIHSDYHTLPFAAAAAAQRHIPLLWTCMGWWFRPKWWQRGFFRQIGHIFAHSQAIKKGFLGEPPFMPPERVEVLYPGVDTARFRPDGGKVRARFQLNVPQDAPLVVMVARFQDVKGHDTFQAIARQVALQMPETRFLVAGGYAQTEADRRYQQAILRAHQQDPLLKDRLRYLDEVEAVERLYAAADVVVVPSRFESYGVVNIEAMASGVPVVSTNRGGPTETVIHGETGYLCAPEDTAQFAAYVIQLLRDEALRQGMGQAARQHVEAHFSAQGNARQFTNALERLLS